MKNKPQEKDKNRVVYYKWDKKRGFTIAGYIIEKKDGK
jgi:hypothetical protein